MTEPLATARQREAAHVAVQLARLSPRARELWLQSIAYENPAFRDEIVEALHQKEVQCGDDNSALSDRTSDDGTGKSAGPSTYDEQPATPASHM